MSFGARSFDGRGRGRGRGRSDRDANTGRSSLFSEGDWKCAMCGNINWARRTACNECQTARPGHGSAAVREGRGGGYMERDERVEYRAQRKDPDGDSEWDEFGRRKKKKPAAVSLKEDQVRSADHPSKDTEEDGEDDDRWNTWLDTEDDAHGQAPASKPSQAKTDASSVAPRSSNDDQRRTPERRHARSRSPHWSSSRRRSRSRSRRHSRSRSRSRDRGHDDRRRGSYHSRSPRRYDDRHYRRHYDDRRRHDRSPDRARHRSRDRSRSPSRR
ncbi:hypothetical protein THASP1DRAFT_28522 [Thamnocephalis sphaerospora]|uniref:RanBP2-type domain-containing protein n=1 Tax=Thamnocephalis sphaerospora TaxID=78915 RepID=A0A4P9XU19_9FUNG|nr:hypothetical protein THASP1DRAFT_28522 [Thamnocephalis sphaerospora]|eukprot:RKP09693.1 hypothetical protein THASP1DRAFT_28522 [Thamnocephalis sphaerospora]